MRFRPCIDIHNGKVKQIVGGSLKDEENHAETNFTSERRAGYFAEMYQRDGLSGGHVILLNPPASEYYGETLKQAEEALAAYPGGLQAGGGIRADNAEKFLDMGASHVIVTSYVFQEGRIRWENLEKLKRAVGKERIVVDLSCRKKDGDYYIVTGTALRDRRVLRRISRPWRGCGGKGRRRGRAAGADPGRVRRKKRDLCGGDRKYGRPSEISGDYRRKG